MPFSCTYILIFVILSAASARFVCSADVEDAVHLYKFKDYVVDDPFQALSTWKLDSPSRPCDWTGVTCDVNVLKTGVPVVRGISLPNKDMLGALWEDIGNLKFLKLVNLTGNRIVMTFPSYINKISILETLDLSNNSLHGVLPPFGNLKYLKTLLLSDNRMEGDFPGTACDGGALRTVDMSRNKLAGVISNSISKCNYLEALRLSGNALHGNIPGTLNQLTRLRVLDLSENQLTGSLPVAVEQMQYLTELVLHNNQFTGSITTSITSAIYLVMLDLSYNEIGSFIPDSIGRLSFLAHLSFSNNKLQGTIPQSIGNLTSLAAVLDLSNNSLTGDIPSSFRNLEHLQKLDLSGNRLSGSLPDIWEKFQFLKAMDLSSNQYNGSIPTSFQSLLNIQYLDLSHNFLNGTLPIELSKLVKLSVVDFSYNNFTGFLPDWLGDISSLSYLDGSHNGFVGSLPLSLQNLSYLNVFDVSYNNLSGYLIDIPIFRQFVESGYLDNEQGLCGPIFNTTCSSADTTDTESETYKFLKSAAEKSQYLPLFTLAIFGVGVVLLLVLCLFFQKCQPKLFRELLEFCDLEVSSMIKCCGRKKRFSYSDLCSATEHFCNRNIIGVGHQCKVFVGELGNDEKHAIKVFNANAFKEIKLHFLEDCNVLAEIQHENVMQLQDWCYKRNFLALVHKYMPNGDLYDALYDIEVVNFLTWDERLGIALDVANGLAYLHRFSKERRRVCCQLCPGNILLDEYCRAKIAGLRVLRESDTTLLMEDVLKKRQHNKKQDIVQSPKDFVNYIAPGE
ncbi:hypothetical protein KP509_13G054000 [Ceratopteris richardii]|uniref:Protein kinase domain-containing protein n=2 Tax=Ceratopteris richardii TaxID=49495 RepID=A0A8T2TFK1_CERRI|nr:hypothetical protein KP509_13G054000 [Ceratopteris richardii]